MKELIRTAVRRPVGVTVIYLAVALFGIVALHQLAVDLLPAVDVPRISITTEYEGVAPEEIETLVTRPIEQATSRIEGVERIDAVSAEGLSRVALQFSWGRKLDRALDDVRIAVDGVRRRLPEGAEPPSVFKFDLSAVPVAYLGLTGSGDPRRLKHLAEEDLSRSLERVSGIASVDVSGGHDREIRVSLDGGRLSALGVSAEQVAQALARENRTVSAGRMRASGREVVIRTAGEFQTLEEIGSVVVTSRDRSPVRVSDLGAVIDTIREVRGELWIDGEPGIRLRVYKQSGANTVEVVDALRHELERVNQQYAGRAQLAILWDSSDFIKAAVTNVQSSAGVGALLAAAVLLLFLRSLRATFVVAVAIPLSIAATFGFMHQLGLTLNVVSFGGLALGVGMLVDGAIVILENIHRKNREGLAPQEAAVEGAREVAGAVVAGTSTTIAVFIPVVFVSGFAGVFFQEMALVVTFALLCSLIIGLTLVPMLSGRWLGHEARSQSGPMAYLGRGFAAGLERLESAYGSVLRGALRAPWAILVGAAVLLGASVVMAQRVGFELMPETDEGRLTASIRMPVGTPLEATAATMQEVEQRVRGALEPGELQHLLISAGPENWWSTAGSNKGSVDLMLVPVAERHRSLDEVESAVHRALDAIPGAEIVLRQSSSNVLTRILRRGDDRITVELRGHDLQTAEALVEVVLGIVRDTPGITFARADRELGQLEQLLHVDRVRAAELGLGSADIATTVEHYLLGRVATRFRDRGDEFDIRVGLLESGRAQLEQLPYLPVVAPDGQRVPLSTLASIEERQGPSTIQRIDQERLVRITAGTAGRSLGEIAADLRARLAELSVPEGFRVSLGGELEEQDRTFRDLLLGLLLAGFLVFAVMAVQFESAIHPFVVMLSVPFAAIGVVLALLTTGTTFNINSFLGTIMLVGIVVNNAIVLIDYTNLLRREHGRDLLSAVITAGTRRLRPIMMTTATTLLALLPLALGATEGSEIQAPLARAVIGGLSTSTLVTLLVVPCAYFIAERRRGIPGVRASMARPGSP